MRERKQGEQNTADAGEGAGESERDPRRQAAMHRRVKERRAGRAGGGVEVVEAGADEMSEVSVDETDIQAVRDRLIDRVENAQTAGNLALFRFESILRHRDAAPALEKGFGETAKKTAIDWYADKLKDIGRGILEAIEIPAAPVEKGVSFAREALEGETEAKQAESKLTIVDELVSTTRTAFVHVTAAAKAAIRSAPAMAVFKADAAVNDQVELISSADVDEIDRRLLSMVRNEMLKSGALTVNEYLDQVKHDRDDGDQEIAAAKKAHKE